MAPPRLSCLMLRNCDISWKSPLLKGLRHLDIRTPSAGRRPGLSVWLDVLDEMPELKTLTLHSATPVVPHGASFPSDVERTVTLLPYTFGYLRPCKRLWIRPCSSRPTGSHLAMPHGKVLSLGWQRRARNPPICFSTRPRTQGCPTALESVRQQREKAHPHSCVDQARSRRRIAPPDRLICRYTNCTLDVHCHKRGLVSWD